MALEVLYGPVNVNVGGVPVASVTGYTWMQGLGLLAVVNPVSAYGFYAVQMDGNAQGPRSTFNGSSFSPVLDLRSVRGLAVATVTDLFNFNYLAGNPDPVSLLTGVSVFRIKVIAADRYLAFYNTGSDVQVLATHDGTTFTPEYTFAAPFTGGTLVNVSRGRSTTEICLIFNAGQIRFYDVSLKKQIGATLFIGEAPDGCWYVPKYDVFVEMKSQQIKILTDATAPDSLSNPVASPSVAAGIASQVSVQLLGAQSEPCVGELINWSIRSGTGTLAEPQSATDATGTAINTLIIPVGSSGSVAVDAQFNF
jgi:hypothetical protein